MVPLKYLSSFWRDLEMPLISCEINLILTWSVNCVIAFHPAAKQATTLAIIDTKLYVPVVTLRRDDNPKLLQQLKSRLKTAINLNKYQSKVTIQMRN